MRTENVIVVSCDSHYLVLLAALLKSIEINAPQVQCFYIIIVESDIAKSDKEKLETSIDKKRLYIHWINMRDVVPSDVELPLDSSSFPLNIYVRLFVPYILPDNVRKALYLDVDMLVLEDISTLFKVEISQAVVAAVADPRVATFDNSWGGIINYRELGIPGNTRYFNTGLLLFNVELWKQQEITQKVINCLNDNIRFLNYPDQYGLNVVLIDKWLDLDSSWNHFASIGNVSPNIIHFVERKPIFKSYKNDLKYQDLFFEYLRLTNWKNYSKIGEIGRLKRKMGNILEKVKLSILRKYLNFFYRKRQ